jgi:hypothetical protein
MPRLLSAAWVLLVAAYLVRAYCSLDPGAELVWKHWFRGETGLLDRAEAILWVPVVVLNVTLCVGAFRRTGFSLTTLWFLGMSCLCAFLLGEEVSWGQHVFGFQPSQAMREMNAQHESNLHNLNLSVMLGLPPESAIYPWLTNFNHVLNPAFYMLATVLFVGLPVGRRLLAWPLLESIPTASGEIATFFGANVLAYLVVDKLLFDVGEVFELAIAVAFFLTAVEAYRTVRLEAAGLELRSARILSTPSA